MAKAMQPQKLHFSQAMQTEKYKNLINNTLGDPVRAARFAANITSAVAVNPTLQECDAGTILAGALLGESLLLQPSPQLGQFYLVPFKSKAKRDRQGNVIEPACLKAQFVLGYKGYIQLALRTGQYKRLNVLEIKSGELGGWDPFEERFHEMHFIEDFEKRAAMPTVGYSQTKAVADAAKDSAETSKAAAETSKDLLNKTTAAAQQAAASAAATNYALGPDESGRLSFFIKKST